MTPRRAIHRHRWAAVEAAVEAAVGVGGLRQGRLAWWVTLGAVLGVVQQPVGVGGYRRRGLYFATPRWWEEEGWVEIRKTG